LFITTFYLSKIDNPKQQLQPTTIYTTRTTTTMITTTRTREAQQQTTTLSHIKLSNYNNNITVIKTKKI